MAHDRDELFRRFEGPGSAFRPMVFWVWNGELERERIRRQVADMAGKGCGGFFIHPMGENFRLADFIQGQSPPYLSDGYFEAVRHAVQAADEYGLYAWLYDEGGWPSGTAQGLVLDGHPEHTAQVLQCETRAAEPGQSIPCPEKTVAALAVFEDHWPEPLEPSEGQVRMPKGTTGVVFCVSVPVPPRVNLLSHAAVRRFIDLTHEQYAESVGDYFETVIPGIFTDEPGVAGRVASNEIPWTRDLLRSFQERRGFDLRPFLPVLFSQGLLRGDIARHFDDTVIAQIRCEFCDHWTDLYQEAYWAQINDWCEAHGLIHTGHVGGEDNLLDHGRHGFGHFFKTAGSLHAPGVDVIWRQLWPGQDNFDFPQFAASAAHQRPGQGGAMDEGSSFDNLVVTETNGVYGFGLTFEQMRWLVDYQCLRGVNLIAPMSYSYETSGGRLYRTMDDIGPGLPQWELYAGFADYVGRLCTVMRSGVALADIGVYYPIEATWIDPDGDHAKAAWESLKAVSRALHEEQVAFDFIDGETIKQGTTGDGALETEGQFYGTIIVPETPALPADVADRLLALYKAGGRVVFVGGIPPAGSNYGENERYAELVRELSAASVTMAREETADTSEGRAEGPVDALRAGRGWEQSSDAALQSQAVVVASATEMKWVAGLLARSTGHYSFHTAEEAPGLRMCVRQQGDLEIGFLMNEGEDALKFELEFVEDTPSILERWTPDDGSRRLLAVHREVSEITRVPMTLGPGESALLALSPIEEADAALALPVHGPRKLPEPVVIDVLESPLSARVESEYRIIDGDVWIGRGDEVARSLSPQLGPWEELGLVDFSGSVAYEFSFIVAEEYLSGEIFLDLGDVRYGALVRLNGAAPRPCLWRPFVMEVSGALKRGENNVTVLVTNTLANQAVREDVVSEARQMGWMNTYYERALPMMQETLQSGLIGPVRLYVER